MNKNLNPKDAERKIKAGKFTVIDVRTPEEFAEGHIAGGVNINISAPDFSQKIESLDKGKEYLVYCRSGGRASRAKEILESAGFGNVYNLTGGITGWVGDGLPTEN